MKFYIFPFQGKYGQGLVNLSLKPLMLSYWWFVLIIEFLVDPSIRISNLLKLTNTSNKSTKLTKIGKLHTFLKL